MISRDLMPEQNWPKFHRRHFEIHFHGRKLLYAGLLKFAARSDLVQIEAWSQIIYGVTEPYWIKDKPNKIFRTDVRFTQVIKFNQETKFFIDQWTKGRDISRNDVAHFKYNPFDQHKCYWKL